MTLSCKFQDENLEIFRPLAGVKGKGQCTIITIWRCCQGKSHSFCYHFEDVSLFVIGDKKYVVLAPSNEVLKYALI